MADVAGVDIYNDVLGLLGSDDIIDVEDSQLARMYRLPQHYNAALHRILSLHDWGFATVVRKLQLEAGSEKPQESTVRIREHDATYRARWTYPEDCQRLIAVGFYDVQNGSESFCFDYPRKHEQGVGESGKRVILTQWGNACAKFVSDRVAPVLWPQTFRDAVVAEMASRMALRTEFAAQMQQAAVLALNAAKIANRNDYGTDYSPSDFVRSRSLNFQRDGYR